MTNSSTLILSNLTPERYDLLETYLKGLEGVEILNSDKEKGNLTFKASGPRRIMEAFNEINPSELHAAYEKRGQRPLFTDRTPR
jgi:hypothetical protein